MAVPLKTRYVTLGGLAMRSLAIESWDWSDLLQDAPKRGANRVIPGQDGTEVRPRTRGEVRAVLQVRVSGGYTTANAVVTPENRQAQFYENLKALRAVTSVTGVQTVSLVTGVKEPDPSTAIVTYSGDVIVEGGGTPKYLNTYTVELALDLTLPNGALL